MDGCCGSCTACDSRSLEACAGQKAGALLCITGTLYIVKLLSEHHALHLFGILVCMAFLHAKWR